MVIVAKNGLFLGEDVRKLLEAMEKQASRAPQPS